MYLEMIQYLTFLISFLIVLTIHIHYPWDVKPPTKLKVKLGVDKMAQKVKNTLTWTPSPDVVVVQKLSVTVAGEALPLVSLDPAVKIYDFLTDGSVHVLVSLVAANAQKDSPAVTLEYEVPVIELPVPAAPGDLNVTFETVEV